MARRGRPPKDPAEKQGHYKPPTLEIIHVEAVAPGGFVVPEPPQTATGADLLDATILLWDRFWLSPVVQALDAINGIDRYGVDDWIRLVNELAIAENVGQANRVIMGSAKQATINPLLKYADSLRVRILEREERLGLNPRDRARLGIAIGVQGLTAEALNRELNRAAVGEPTGLEDLEGEFVDDVPLEEWTLAELRLEARRMEVPGRSRMSRAALIAALQEVAS